MPAARTWCLVIPSVLAAAGVLAVWQRGGLTGEAVAVIAERPRAPVAVTALGRIQPKDGVVRIAGPSGVSLVIAELLVEQGDRVEAGAVVARLDQWELRRAGVARARAELEHAERELRRFDRLFDEAIVSAAERDARRMRARTAAAELALAEAELALATVRAPVAGQVLKVHARAGEKVGSEGIAELGRTDPMYVVAEVYETDVGRVRLGQRATVASPALDGVLEGTVERVGLMVGRKDVLGVDPVDEADARVVEVEVRLDDGARVAALTHLQVEVAIRP